MPSSVGNKSYQNQGPVTAGIETTVFNFVVANTPNAFYGATGVQVSSPSGALDYYLRLYTAAGFLAALRSDDRGNVALSIGFLTLIANANLNGTVTHGDLGAQHYFDCLVLGQGVM